MEVRSNRSRMKTPDRLISLSDLDRSPILGLALYVSVGQWDTCGMIANGRESGKIFKIGRDQTIFSSAAISFRTRQAQNRILITRHESTNYES